MAKSAELAIDEVNKSGELFDPLNNTHTIGILATLPYHMIMPPEGIAAVIEPTSPF